MPSYTWHSEQEPFNGQSLKSVNKLLRMKSKRTPVPRFSESSCRVTREILVVAGEPRPPPRPLVEVWNLISRSLIQAADLKQNLVAVKAPNACSDAPDGSLYVILRARGQGSAARA